jgi:hypothetical protein
MFHRFTCFSKAFHTNPAQIPVLQRLSVFAPNMFHLFHPVCMAGHSLSSIHKYIEREHRRSARWDGDLAVGSELPPGGVEYYKLLCNLGAHASSQCFQMLQPVARGDAHCGP